MISRRGFLKGMLGLAAAPAICKAENLMKIIVPSQELIIPDQKLGRGMTEPIVHVDEAAFYKAGDYDGDSISFHEINVSEGLTQYILSQKHLPGSVLIHQENERKKIMEHVNKSPMLSRRLAGKTVYASRSPFPGEGVMIRF